MDRGKIRLGKLTKRTSSPQEFKCAIIEFGRTVCCNSNCLRVMQQFDDMKQTKVRKVE